MSVWRQDFPFFTQASDIYLDSAATTQKPLAVLEAMSHFYTRQNANVHRGAHRLSAEATTAFEACRDVLRQFLGARYRESIIWTRGATEAINLVAMSWGCANLKAGDQVLVSTLEHHANIVPWQQVCEQTHAELIPIPLDDNANLDMRAFKVLISSGKVKMVAVTQVSNALGVAPELEKVIQLAHGEGARVLVDGSQAVAHTQVNLDAMDCDFYVCSAHKMYGPTGIGLLYGKKALLEAMPVFMTGGEMIEKVSFEHTRFNVLPFKFEPGTPNLSGVMGFAAAARYLNSLDRNQVQAHENALAEQFRRGLGALKGYRLVGDNQGCIASFVHEELHPADVATLLDKAGIGVRAGHHCAMPLMQALSLEGTVRASFALYNTAEEVERLLQVLGGFADSQTPALCQSTPMADKLRAAKGWQQRYRVLMQQGKHSAMSEADFSDDELVPGCESRVWLKLTLDNGRYRISAHSDSRILRGLLSLLLEWVQGQTAEEIAGFDFHGAFDEFGLLQHLSPSRGNGLLAIVKHLQSLSRT